MKQRFSKRTRLVSALLTLAMVFTFLPFSAFADDDVDFWVPLHSENFPDKTYLEYIRTTFDKGGSEDGEPNGILEPGELRSVTEIDVSGMNITSLWGSTCFHYLTKLNCSDNQLTSLNLSYNTKLTQENFECSGNKYPITIDETERTFDLSTLPAGFDVTKASGWVGGTAEGNTLKVNPGATQVTYTYDCGNGLTAQFALTVKESTTGCTYIPLNAYNFPDPAFRECLKKPRFDNDEDEWLSSPELNDIRDIWVPQKGIASLKGIEKFPNLTTLKCSKNQLTELDVSQNKKLVYLECSENQLTSLDLSDTKLTPAMFECSGNKYPITVDNTNRKFDLNTLPAGFEVSKVTNWEGGSVNGNTLTVNKDANEVTYTYDCGNGLFADFTLVVNGGGSTGGGSTGGGTPGGSTGGTISPEAGKYQLTVIDGFATVNDGSTGHVLNVKPGDTVTLTADTTKFPENEEFGWWEITPYGSVSNTLTGQYQRTATFTMPNENVSARAMSKSAGVSTGGDDGGGGGGAAILLVGGAAVAGLVGYGVYSYVSEQQLKALLPEGVAMPENRAQTALLLWNTAGRPEPAEAPAFKDVADPDTAKAAQWCVEHGLMDQKLGGRFAPDNSDPAYKTLNAYQQLVG